MSSAKLQNFSDSDDSVEEVPASNFTNNESENQNFASEKHFNSSRKSSMALLSADVLKNKKFEKVSLAHSFPSV